MAIRVEELTLRVSLHHPFKDLRSLPRAVENLVDVIPSHSMYFDLELVLHFLILIFRLFGEEWNIGRDIPTFDHEIAAACYEHIVFGVIDVDHVE
jgi:hypothetical protein